MIHPGRFTAEIDGDFVVFLIGAQIHKPLKVRQWFPVAKAMRTMQTELGTHPETGCLHIDNYGAVNGISVQYWRSYGHLERFARSNDWSHLAAWREFNKLIRDSGDLGIWHETYRVAEGEYESIYGNATEFGLAKAGRHLPIQPRSTGAQRLGETVGKDQIDETTAEPAPVEGY